MEITSPVEMLADLEHEQWVEWSHSIADELHQLLVCLDSGTKAEARTIIQTRLDRWKEYWVPYDELSEDAKKHDRKWARRAYEVMTQ